MEGAPSEASADAPRPIESWPPPDLDFNLHAFPKYHHVLESAARGHRREAFSPRSIGLWPLRLFGLWSEIRLPPPGKASNWLPANPATAHIPVKRSKTAYVIDY